MAISQKQLPQYEAATILERVEQMEHEVQLLFRAHATSDMAWANSIANELLWKLSELKQSI